jgi:hypothetical protein
MYPLVQVYLFDGFNHVVTVSSILAATAHAESEDHIIERAHMIEEADIRQRHAVEGGTNSVVQCV